MSFNPNHLTLAQGIDIIKKAQKDLGLTQDKIITSHDVPGLWTNRDLRVTNIPGGFNKVMLPFYFEGASTFYISSAGPNLYVPAHSHDEGAGFRFIASGSIIYNGKEFKGGDWMFVPAKATYEFRVGPTGVLICYCYQCCCA